jgi:undecaprenyl-diphosphatase
VLQVSELDEQEERLLATTAVSGPPRWRVLLLLFPALLAAGLAAGWLVDPGGHQSVVQYVDDAVRNWVLVHRPPGTVHVMRPLMALGSLQAVALAAVVLSCALLVLRRRWQALVPLLAVGGGDLLVLCVKYTIGRHGPAASWLHPGVPAFPSGHTAGVTAVVVPLAVLAWTTRRWWWPAVVAALLIGLMGATLLLVDAHWFSDIAASVVLVGIWSAAVAALLPSPQAKRGDSGVGVGHEAAAHPAHQ